MDDKRRLTSEMRRQSILKACIPVFARQGFHGTSTKDLARASGTSEALLYRHFESKDKLYVAIQDYLCGTTLLTSQDLGHRKPGSETLVLGVYFLVRTVFLGSGHYPEDHEMVQRLLVYSLLEDGRFARVLLDAQIAVFIPRIEESMRASEAAGDLRPSSTPASTRVWLAHHLTLMLAVTMLPERKVIDYQTKSPQRLIDETCEFVLRGIGLSDSAIARYFNPKTLNEMVKGLFGAAQNGTKEVGRTDNGRNGNGRNGKRGGGQSERGNAGGING